MLVQGFIDLVGHTLCGNTNNAITTFGGGVSPTSSDIITSGSTEYGFNFSANTGSVAYLKPYPYKKQIILGKSDTPPTAMDNNISDFDRVATGTHKTYQNKVVVTGTYTNTATEAKTFKEIGLVMGSSNNASVPTAILLSRSVFPEPVVIPAGESKSFTITIDFNKFADTVVTA